MTVRWTDHDPAREMSIGISRFMPATVHAEGVGSDGRDYVIIAEASTGYGLGRGSGKGRRWRYFKTLDEAKTSADQWSREGHAKGQIS